MNYSTTSENETIWRKFSFRILALTRHVLVMELRRNTPTDLLKIAVPYTRPGFWMGKEEPWCTWWRTFSTINDPNSRAEKMTSSRNPWFELQILTRGSIEIKFVKNNCSVSITGVQVTHRGNSFRQFHRTVYLMFSPILHCKVYRNITPPHPIICIVSGSLHFFPLYCLL